MVTCAPGGERRGRHSQGHGGRQHSPRLASAGSHGTQQQQQHTGAKTGSSGLTHGHGLIVFFETSVQQGAARIVDQQQHSASQPHGVQHGMATTQHGRTLARQHSNTAAGGAGAGAPQQVICCGASA